MRITHNILTLNFLRNLNAISNRIERTQQQLSTGQNYSRPGQGPVEVGQIVGFKSSISKITQYLKNVDDGVSQAEYIDTRLQAIIDEIGRARDLATDAASDNLNLADRQATGQEVNLILESTFSNANTRFRDRYTFAGWETRAIPFEAIYNPGTGSIEDIYYSGDRGKIDRLVGDGDQLTVNVTGKELFMEQTYTLSGRQLPTDRELGFDGIITVNGIDVTIRPDDTLRDIQLRLEAISNRTHVFARIDNSRLVLESGYAVRAFALADNRQNKLLENLGLYVSGAFNVGMVPPTLPIIDSTPAIFTGAGPVANLTYDNTNNTLNIFLGADANGGISKAANVFITPGTYASVADLIAELQIQIDRQFGAGKIKVSDAGGGVLQLETVATGDEIDAGDLVIGGPLNGYPDTASDSADLNLVAVVGNAPATPAGTAGTDGNDKIIIDLGPTTSKNGSDVPPQVIDLRASMITTPDDLVDELNYQIFQNDVLRGAVEVRLYNGRLYFETVKEGADVLAQDFQISEGATGTLAALGISDVSTPAQYVGSPLVFPFIVVAGFNDTVTIDLGPTVSVDGTDPAPITVTINAGIYGNINAIYNEVNSKILANPALNGSIHVEIGGPPGAEYLVLVSNKIGSGVRGEDMTVTGPLAGTLGWLAAGVVEGGGSADGRGLITEPANIFNTLISIRDDMMGFVGPKSKLLDAMNTSGELLSLIEGDIVTVTYDAGTFTFRVLAGDRIADLAESLQEIFGTRATVSVTTDGRIRIDNEETFQIHSLSISAASATGQSRDLFNQVMERIQDSIPGLSTATTEQMYDPRRYLRLGDEDLLLIDNDLETLLRHEAIVGARGNRLSTVTNLFTAEKLNIDELKNTIEAANYAEVLTLLSQQELVLQSSLAVGAKVLTPSLLDFLT